MRLLWSTRSTLWPDLTFIEALTTQMEEGAEAYFQRIEELGGVLAAIEENFFQQEIADAAYHYQKEIESKDRIIVGVNEFIQQEKPAIDLLIIDSAIERAQAKRVQQLRLTRDNLLVQNILDELRQAAAATDNLMPKIIAAVRAYATEGEIVAVLKEVFGEYREHAVF